MIVRPSILRDIEAIMAIYAYAREQMRLNGNPTQWGDCWPEEWAIRRDIERQVHFTVVDESGVLVAVFAFIIGEEPTYRQIEGAWLNDASYGTLHRVASSGKAPGILRFCLDFCESKIGNIRVDTHQDNVIMRHLLGKYGYQECGIIIVEDGTPRIAYQKTIY